MNIAVLAVLIVTGISLLGSGFLADGLSELFNTEESKDAAFVVLLICTVASLLKVLWDAFSNNDNPLKLFISVFTTLVLALASIILAHRFGIVEQTRAAYMVVAAITAISLPWLFKNRLAKRSHSSYLLALYIITLAITTVVFGILHRVAAIARTPLLGEPTDSVTSLVLIAPMAVGIAATTWAVLQFGPKHHSHKCSTFSTDHRIWQSVYLIVAIALVSAYAVIFTPSRLTPEQWNLLAATRVVLICLLLLLSPIIAVTIHDRWFRIDGKSTWLSLPVTGLAVGTLSAMLVVLLVQLPYSQKIELDEKDLVYLVLVHSLLGLASMGTYLGIWHLMKNFPWPWLLRIKDTLNNEAA